MRPLSPGRGGPHVVVHGAVRHPRSDESAAAPPTAHRPQPTETPLPSERGRIARGEALLSKAVAYAHAIHARRSHQQVGNARGGVTAAGIHRIRFVGGVGHERREIETGAEYTAPIQVDVD